VRAVKHRSDTVQIYPDSRASTLRDLATQGIEKPLDIFPRDIGALWFFNNPIKGPLVSSVHLRPMISCYSITSSGLVGISCRHFVHPTPTISLFVTLAEVASGLGGGCHKEITKNVDAASMRNGGLLSPDHSVRGDLEPLPKIP